MGESGGLTCVNAALIKDRPNDITSHCTSGSFKVVQWLNREINGRLSHHSAQRSSDMIKEPAPLSSTTIPRVKSYLVSVNMVIHHIK